MATPPAVRPSPAGDDSSDTDARALDRLFGMLNARATDRALIDAIARLSLRARQQLLGHIGQVLPGAERLLASPANATSHGIARLLARLAERQPHRRADPPGAGGAAVGSGGSGSLAKVAVAAAAGVATGAAIGMTGAALVLGAEEDGNDPADLLDALFDF